VGSCFIIVLVFLCFFDNIIMSIASTIGFSEVSTEVFQKCQQSIKNHDTLKCISKPIMIQFGTKYQYHDTIEVSYPTLPVAEV